MSPSAAVPVVRKSPKQDIPRGRNGAILSRSNFQYLEKFLCFEVFRNATEIQGLVSIA